MISIENGSSLIWQGGQIGAVFGGAILGVALSLLIEPKLCDFETPTLSLLALKFGCGIIHGIAGAGIGGGTVYAVNKIFHRNIPHNQYERV